MEPYDQDKSSKYIVYLDANNFYEWAMNWYLQTGRFEWLTQEEI